jgi:hypothetical protein
LTPPSPRRCTWASRPSHQPQAVYGARIRRRHPAEAAAPRVPDEAGWRAGCAPRRPSLHTHTPDSLYEAFPPEEAKRLAERLELHYAPKHGSWLNIAEIELSVLARQCLDRRIPDRATLAREVAAWEAAQYAAGGAVDWQFRTENARVKLKHVYPSL